MRWQMEKRQFVKDLPKFIPFDQKISENNAGMRASTNDVLAVLDKE